MTVLSVTQFSGVAPRFPARSLEQPMAQTAVNCNLLNGVLKAFAGPSNTLYTSAKTGALKTIYRFGQSQSTDATYWFNWLTDVDVVKGPIAGDTNERTYYTGDGAPKMTTATLGVGADLPNAYRALGIEAPTTAPTVGTSGTGTGTPATRVYVYTFVSDLMEEGPPSPASAEVNVATGQSVLLTGFPTTLPTGVNRVRIYRSLAGTTVSKYQKVGEYVSGINIAPWSGTTFTDSVADTALGAILATTDWVAPPARLSGLTVLPNGIVAGFQDNEVFLSEPYTPHAWPYSSPLEFPVVAIAAIAGQGVAVATKGPPYLGTGAHPKYMTFTRLPQNYACVAKQSMVSVAGAAIYASTDGLVSISGQGAQLVTAPIYTRKEWALLNPSSFRAYQWQNRYVCFYTNTSGVKGGFIFDPSMQSPQLTFLNFYANAGYFDPIYGHLYLVLDSAPSAIVRFDYTGALNYTWKSKKFHTPAPTNFGAAQVLAETYPVTFTYYADSTATATHTQSVLSADAFRLPAGFVARDHEFQIDGTATVYAVHVASTMGELRGV